MQAADQLVEVRRIYELNSCFWSRLGKGKGRSCGSCTGQSGYRQGLGARSHDATHVGNAELAFFDEAFLSANYHGQSRGEFFFSPIHFAQEGGVGTGNL